MNKERWAYYQKEIQRLRKLDKQITERVRATYSIKKKKKNDK
tara:strand:+ start:242 stop:367 length:126 start_codon:yes stop_codon:yes gene_type:complete